MKNPTLKAVDNVLRQEIDWCQSKEGRELTGYTAKERRLFIEGLLQARRLVGKLDHVPDWLDREKQFRAKPISDNEKVSGLQINDEVTWKSQAGGFWKTKTGTVVAVVPPRVSPLRVFPEEYKPPRVDGVWATRDHESYLVYVRGQGRRLYWPRINELEIIDKGEPR